MKDYTLSLLTSSTITDLSDLTSLFVGSGLADCIEFYLARLTDQGILKISTLDERPHKSPAYLLSKRGYRGGGLDPVWIKGLANRIDDLVFADELGTGKVTKRELHARRKRFIRHEKMTAIATYFPEITSADRELRDDAIKALEVAVRLADILRVPGVECVAGRHDEGCAEDSRDCHVVMSYHDYADPQPSEDVPLKVKWLVEGIRDVYAKLTADGELPGARLMLEMEPGMLFVLSRPEAVRHVLQKTADLTTSGGLKFVGMNCDIGHMLIMADHPPIDPGVVWQEILGGVGQPSEYVGNFHASWHPYCRVHLDHPPTADRRYRIPETAGEGFRCKWGVPEDLIPWLNCVLCMSEHWGDEHPANISLELEAASRDELAIIGLKSLRSALDRLDQKRKANPLWVMRTCASCPQAPRRKTPKKQLGMQQKLSSHLVYLGEQGRRARKGGGQRCPHPESYADD